MIGYNVAKNVAYFQAVYCNAVELTAELCRIYGLDPLEEGVVICHSEGYRKGIASNHADVTHWFPKHGKTMDDFRRDVAAALAGETAGAEEQEETNVEQEKTAETKVYVYLEDTPDWCRASLQKAMDRGVLKGTGGGRLDVSADFCKTVTLLDRLGLLDSDAGASAREEEKK